MESLGKLKVSVLKDELRTRGGDSRGSKATLLTRLKELLEKDGVEVEDFVAAKMGQDKDDSAGAGTKVPSPDPIADEGNRSRGSLSGIGSVGSLRSTSSVSVSSLLAAESARKAGLKAKVEFLEEKRRLELEELDMRMRREDCELRCEIAEAEAKERVLAEHISSSGSGAQAHGVRSVGLIPAVTEASQEAEVPSAQHRPSRTRIPCARGGPQEQPPSRGQADPCVSVSRSRFDPHGTGNNTLRGAEPDRTKPDTSDVLMNHLQRGQLPSPAIPVFNGDVTKYQSFVRAFDSRIASKTTDDEERLYYLEQYTSGKPRDVIKGCLHMPPGRGYAVARQLLDRRYGDPDSISAAFVDMILEWPQLKPGDIEGLDRYALTLTSCLNVMEGIPVEARETDHPRTMRKVIEKLPQYMQDNWRRHVDQLRGRVGRKVCFEDIVAFVDKEVTIQTDPTFWRQHRSGKVDPEKGKRAYTVTATSIQEN